MKNKILVLLFSVAFLLTSCSNDEVVTNTTTASTKKIELQNTTTSDFDELVDPDDGLGGSGLGGCDNSYTLTGTCTQPGSFTGYFKFDDCKKYKATFTHNNQTISGLKVTLPLATGAIKYTFISPSAWTYNASTQQFIITIPIKKTETYQTYPINTPPNPNNPNSPNPPTGQTTTTITTYFYKTLMINTCTSTVSPS